MSKSALIFGASGVTGWAFVNELLNDYPKHGVWGKVHALTNRPLTRVAAIWPSDDRLDIVSGIDLLAGSQEDLEETMKIKITGIENVTHVFYLAFKASKDLDQELKDAVAMFKRSTIAIEHLSPSLEFVVLQTGAKMYGCHLLGDHPTDYLSVPHKESQPRLKAPYHDMLFYHPQLDWITEYASDKKWSWCDTRPDIIIGFVPNQNFYSLAQPVATFCTLWRQINGEGAECPYPGTSKAWVAKSIDSSSDMIARQTIYLALSKETEKGGGYNVADAKYSSSWETKWPVICGWFGLKGVGPLEGNPIEMRTYIKEHMDLWEKMEKEKGLKTGIVDSELTFKGFEYFLLTQFDFDRQYDMTKMYTTGFTEERTTAETWLPVFQRMRDAKIIP